MPHFTHKFDAILFSPSFELATTKLSIHPKHKRCCEVLQISIVCVPRIYSISIVVCFAFAHEPEPNYFITVGPFQLWLVVALILIVTQIVGLLFYEQFTKYRCFVFTRYICCCLVFIICPTVS